MPAQLTAEGTYHGKITAWGLRAAGTGTTQWVVTVLVTGKAKNDDDISAGFDELDPPLKRTVYSAITGNTVERVIDEAKSIGFDSTNPLDLDPKLGPHPFDFEGVEVNLNCTHDEYKGKVKERWQINRRKDKLLSADQVENFAALFGDTFKDRMEDKPKPEEEAFNKF